MGVAWRGGALDAKVVFALGEGVDQIGGHDVHDGDDE
jgi:hypothetical protein